jgi:large subunit ribosomal protein L15
MEKRGLAMPARIRRKFSRMRGTGSHGWGGKKKHRGGGSQGGKGQSGMLKHKKSWMIKYDPKHFGRKGFNIPYSRKEKAISLKDLDIFAKKHNKKEINVSELGYQKVLSSGKLTQPLTIKAKKFVENAKQKIEKAGGKFIEG